MSLLTRIRLSYPTTTGNSFSAQHKFKSSLLLSLAQFGTAFAVELVSITVLARLLTPKDMGVFATAMAVIAFFQFLCNFGLYEFVIQTQTISPDVRQSVIGLSACIAWMTASLVALGTWLTPASILGDEVRTTIWILTATLALQPFALPPMALLHRTMRFGVMYIAKLLASLVFPLVGISLAMQGFGPESLAWATLASAVTFAVSVTICSGCAFVCWPSFRGWLRIVRFSGTLMSIHGIHQFAESLVSLLVGQISGYTNLGNFTRAQNLTQFFNKAVHEVLTPVLFPFLSQHVREGGDLKQAYLLRVTYLSSIYWPLAAFLALYAEPITLILLGPQWRDVIVLVSILSVGAMSLPFHASALNFAIALGLERRYLPLQVFINGLKIVLVAVLAFVSIEWASVGIVTVMIVFVGLAHYLFKETLNLTMREVLDAATTSFVATLTGLLIPIALRFSVTGEMFHDLAVIVMAGVGMVVAWSAGLWWLNHPLKSEILGLVNQQGRSQTRALNSEGKP